MDRSVASRSHYKLSTLPAGFGFTLYLIMKIRTPYLLFLGEAGNNLETKTANGLAYWRPELCTGQWRLPNCAADAGLQDMMPAEAVRSGARSLVIGVAPTGGRLPPAWIPALSGAIRSGLDIVSGLHARLTDIPELVDMAQRHGRRLVDVRVPPGGISVASGQKRPGKRLLTVGTDCCVGKKYTALALHRAMKDAGTDCDFRASGQTGIMIAGEGIPMDAVVADFLPGAAEMLSPANKPEHWDLVEGQGSLFHPGYAAVTLGLVHGSQPDVMVLCHEAGRSDIDEYPGFAIPPLPVCIAQYEQAAQLTNPAARVIGMSVNTSTLPSGDREGFLEQLAKKSGLPCVDPALTGVQPILDVLP